MIEMLDPHRALLNARAARGALPELFFGDVVVEQSILEDRGDARVPLVAFAVHERVVRELGPIAEQQRRLLHEPAARVDDDLARTQHLAGNVRGTRIGAAATLGARVTVEQILPCELIDIGRTELLDALRLEIEKANHSLRPRPLRIREVDVGNRRHDVQMLRVRQVVEKAEHQQRVRPPEHAVRAAEESSGERLQRHREREREWLRARERLRVECQLDRVHDEHGHHQRGDSAENQIRVAVLELVALETWRMQHEPPVECECDRAEHEEAEEVLRDGVELVERCRKKVVRERWEASVQQQLDRPHGEHAEAPEDERVHRTRDRVTQNLLLQDRDRDDVLESYERVAAAVVRLGYLQIRKQPLNVVRKKADGANKDEQENGVFGSHGTEAMARGGPKQPAALSPSRAPLSLQR